MSESLGRKGRSHSRTSTTRRKRTRELTISPSTTTRSRSPLITVSAGPMSSSVSAMLSKEQLLMEIKDLGVDLPSNLGIKYVRQVYERLTDKQSPANHQLDNPATAINSSPTGSSGNTHSSEGESPITEVRRQLLDLQSTVANINHRLNSTLTADPGCANGLSSEQTASSTNQGTQIQGIPIDTLPPINIVTPQVRKTIKEKSI